MPLDHYTCLECTHKDRVLTITIKGQGSVNAIGAILHTELAQIFNDAQDDPDSDIIILTGEDGYFSAGGDIDWFQDMVDDPRKFRSIAIEAKRIVYSLIDLEKPIICRLNGPAAGLGATIALFCDMIIASKNAYIGDPHVKVGLVAGDGGAIIWPQLIGFAKAKELLLTGDMIAPEKAEALGLINYVVEEEALDAKVEEVIKKIADNPRWAVRWTKTITNISLRQIAGQIMDAAMGYEMISNMTEDRREAVAAFKERRPPQFGGE